MKNSKIYIQYLGACRFRDKICFPNREFNRIFSIDVKNFVLNFEQNISFLKNQEEYPYYGNLHCIYNDRIFFFPYNCSYVMVYDLQTNDTKGIFIKTADGLNTYWTAGIFQCKEKVIIFPSKMIQGIFVLDLKTLQIVRDIELEKALYDVEFIYNYDNVIKLNETEVVFLSGRHTIIGFDIQNKKKIFSRRFEGLDIWGIRYDGSNFWLLLYDSTDVYKWNQINDSLIVYRLVETEWINNKGVPYTNLIFLDNQIFVLPCSLKYIMRMNLEMHTISKAAGYPDGFRFFDDLWKWPAFAAFDIVDKQKILIHPVRGNMLLIYDVEKNYIEGKELTIGTDEISYVNGIVRQKFCWADNIVIETDFFDVKLLDVAVNQDRNETNTDNVQIGERIFNTLIRKS